MLVDEARAISDLISVGADEAERLRRLPAATVTALAHAGMFTMCLPTAYGGPGEGPLGLVDATIELARADGAAGWCAGIASTTSSLAAYLDPGVARTVFDSPAAATGGVFAPNGVGAFVDGTHRVTGRWQWGSGTQHATWIVGGFRAGDATQRVGFFRADQVTFHDTWHTSGLCGTGSLDFSVDDAEVHDDYAVIVGSAPRVDEAIARFPNFTLLALGVSAAALGIARRALDELIILAGAKRPQYSTRMLAESPFTHIEFSRAEARWRSAVAYLRSEVDRAWESAVTGGQVSVDQRVAIRLAAAQAVSESVAATTTAWQLAGGTAVYDTSVLGRCLRDVNVVTQHIMVAPKLHETLGKHLLGVEFNPTMI
jgi:alkylation response protein AidB-like acyl-CoA dehydrogenase